MLRYALVAAAFTPAVVSAQVIEVTTDRSVIDLSVPGGNVVNVSVTIDRQGYADGPWADFQGWNYFATYLVANGGQFQIPIENGTDESGGPWEGRRPPSIHSQSGGNNGGFRFAVNAHEYYLEGPGSGQWFNQGNPTPGQFSQWETILGMENTLSPGSGQSLDMIQAGSSLGGFQQDQSDRIEIFRARMRFDTPGVHEITAIPQDCAFWDTPELIYAVLGLEEVLSVMSIQVATVEARIPAPATLLALGVLPLFRRRR